MGSCGCSEQGADFKFPGPKGIVYTLTVSLPCEYCQTPLGFFITKNFPKDVEMYDIESVPELTFNKAHEAAFAMFDPQILEKSLNSFVDDVPGYDNVDVEEFIVQDLPDVILESQKCWRDK